ncbi:MAG: FAD binding domain-containing protein [Actinomycetota bacterium]
MTQLVVPSTVAELGQVIGSGRVIAGGTDLLVQMRAGREEERLIDITNLADGPSPVVHRDGVVEVSAVASISSVIEALAGRLPAIAAAARVFGSRQIRNRATIGGNLANASPAADMVPPLVAAGAEAVVQGRVGSRTVLVSELSTGPGTTVLEPEEWISLLRVPLPHGEEGFLKLGGRAAMAISIVSLAWRWRTDTDGNLHDVRLAFGAVAPTVIRVTEAEAAIEGQRPTPDVVNKAVSAIRRSVRPIDDIRASAWYRRQVAADLFRYAVDA